MENLNISKKDIEEVKVQASLSLYNWITGKLTIEKTPFEPFYTYSYKVGAYWAIDYKNKEILKLNKKRDRQTKNLINFLLDEACSLYKADLKRSIDARYNLDDFDLEKNKMNFKRNLMKLIKEKVALIDQECENETGNK